MSGTKLRPAVTAVAPPVLSAFHIISRTHT